LKGGWLLAIAGYDNKAIKKLVLVSHGASQAQNIADCGSKG